MSDFYSDLRAVASNVLSEFKQGSVSYVRMQSVVGATPDDPGTPIEVVSPLNATVRPVSTKYVDGSHIIQSDRQVTMPNDGIEPKMSGFIRIDGSDHKIIEIMPRPAAGDPITYTVIVRR